MSNIFTGPKQFLPSMADGVMFFCINCYITKVHVWQISFYYKVHCRQINQQKHSHKDFQLCVQV